jgi:hypothetical protein
MYDLEEMAQHSMFSREKGVNSSLLWPDEVASGAGGNSGGFGLARFVFPTKRISHSLKVFAHYVTGSLLGRAPHPSWLTGEESCSSYNAVCNRGFILASLLLGLLWCPWEELLLLPFSSLKGTHGF